jgi:hypothetical protein
LSGASAGLGVGAGAAAAITLPASIRTACHDVAAGARVRVLCPPAGGHPAPLVRLVHDDLDADPCIYLTNLEALGSDPGDARPYRIMLGGTCTPFRLVARNGRWAADPPTTLRIVGSPPVVPGSAPRITRPHVIRRLRVRGHPGLLMRSDPFPEGGLHGGHYELVWNERGAGYAVSAHWASGDRGLDPRPDQVRALLGLAGALRPA